MKARMKKPILYVAAIAAVAATTIMTIAGCGGDFGERSEKMDAFLNKFSGLSDTATVRYTITFKANGGNGTPPNPMVVPAGTEIKLPNEGTLSMTGHNFAGWNTDSLGAGNNFKGGDSYTPKSSATLYAQWIGEEKVSSVVTVVSAGTGASGGGTYENGKTITINAGIAPDGQQFQNWTASPSVTFASSSSPTTTFTMPTHNVTVTAKFGAVAEGKHAVTVSSIGVGASGSNSYTAGTTVSISAGNDPFGHRFQNWTTESSGVIFGNANNRTTTFVMPDSAVTVTANFYAVPTYEFRIVSEGNGASRDSSYREGDTVKINAGTAPASMRFKNWTVTSGGVTLANAESAATTFIMPTKAVTVTANFQPNTYTVTVSAGTGATGGGEYYPGVTVSISAGSHPDGLSFSKWTISKNSVVFADANNAVTTFVMPSSAVTVMADFSGFGMFTDSRNSKTYKTVFIGNNMWMGENLNYDTASGMGSWCYGNDNSNCEKYGRLYNWNTAMGGKASSAANPSGVQGVCPVGLHLPSRAEWGELAKAAGGSGDYGTGGIAGKALKSTSGWISNGNGTDEYGVSALPGGDRSSDGSFNGVGDYGNWWTATESSGGIAYSRGMYYGSDDVGEGKYDKSYGRSVRCLRDD